MLKILAENPDSRKEYKERSFMNSFKDSEVNYTAYPVLIIEKICVALSTTVADFF